MRLLDQIVQRPEPVLVQQSNGGLISLPGADTLAARLEACPIRYVLADDVVETCTEAAFDPPGMLGDCCDLIRVPAPMLWIEYNTAACHRAMHRNGCAPEAPSQRQLAGMLVQANAPAYRSGVITLAWESLHGHGAEVGPLTLHFDLDGAAPAAEAGVAVAPPAIDALQSLFKRTRLTIDPQWRAYYATFADNQRHFDDLVHRSAEAVFGSAPLAFALFLLIMARTPLVSRPSDLAALNRARAKRGKRALLDHVELRLDLSREVEAGASPSTPQRQGPRLHMVRGHLVRRRDHVFWRSPHLRGNATAGAILHRTVTIMGA